MRVFLRTRRTVAYETSSIRPHSIMRSAKSRKLHRSRPAEGVLQASVTRWASWRPSSLRRLPGRGDHPAQPPAGRQKPLAHLGNRHRRGMQRRGDRLCRLLFISQEQRVCPANRAGWCVALLNEGIEQTALVVTQLLHIFLGHGFP